MSTANFAELSASLEKDGAIGLLESLANQLRNQKSYHELFDALLMRERLRLGLPISAVAPLSELPDQERTQLEQAYLQICREVGFALLAERRVREAWPYLRPLEERSEVVRQIKNISPEDDNLQALVEILLHEGVDIEAGYQLILNHYGVCNAISAFDGIVMARPKQERLRAAEQLVRQVHDELVANVRADIERREGSVPPHSSLRELLSTRPELFENNTYHIDTSHLASTVRYARMLESPTAISWALDLADYGRRLSEQFQFEGEEPFTRSFEHDALFLGAQLNVDRDAALAHFKERAEQVDAYHQGTLAAEVYVVLLARLLRYQEAIEFAAEKLPPGTHTTGFAPQLMELCQQAGDYRKLIQVCQERGDTVGFAAALLAQQALANSAV